MTPSKALMLLCVAFALGVAIKSYIKIPQIFLWGILFLATILIFASLLSKNNFLIYGFCLIALILGIFRLQAAEFNLNNDDLQLLNGVPEKVTFRGQIIGEPHIREKFQKLKVKAKLLNSVVLVTAGRYPSYSYLDEVNVTGQLKTPPEFEDFSYKNYLVKEGIYSVMDFPKIELASRDHSYNIFSYSYENILILKSKLAKSLQKSFSENQSSILEGIIFGNDKNMSEELKDKFSKTGLNHITAVSGGNIVILISILVPFLILIGLWRTEAIYFSIASVWIYIALVGFPSSGIRAAIMGTLFLLSQKLGRQNTSSRTIILAAALMLMQNPWILAYDIGFQLSFLASMGILYIKPLLDNFLFSKKSGQGFLKNKISYFTDIVSVTLSAQISTLPIIIYNFGALSLVAPVTNFLILPIVPFLMIFGFLSSIFGMFSLFLGWVFALPCHALILYMMKIMDIFNKSWASKDFNYFPLWLCIGYYFVILFLVWFLNKKLKFTLEY